MKVLFFALGYKQGDKIQLLGKGLDFDGVSAHFVNIGQIFSQSDIISLHVPLVTATRHMINAKSLSTMKPDAMLINTSRDGVINEPELIAHLDANSKFRFACDVFKGEPSYKKGDFDSKLAKHASVVCSHHIGAGTAQATFAVGDGLYNQLALFVRSGRFANCVNFPSPKL